MRKIVVLLSLLLPLCAFGQSNELQNPRRIYIGDDGLCMKYEFSSIGFRNDTIILFSEKCGALVKALIKRATKSGKPDSLKLAGPITHIKDGDGPKEIEGLAIYRGAMIVSDEGNPSVWQYCGSPDNAFRKVYEGREIKDCTGNNGLEGIAADEKANICYLLRERNNSNPPVPELYLYSILLDANSNIRMSPHNPCQIALPPLGPHCRYADVYFDSDTRRLLLLRSCFYYDKNRRKAECIDYGIDALQVDSNGNIVGKPVPLQGSNLLANLVRDSCGMMENNIEGVALKDGTFYIMSNNSQDSVCREELGKCPLMIQAGYFPLRNNKAPNPVH